MVLIPSTVVALIVGVLVILLLIVIPWSLYEYHLATSKEKSLSVNPYCLREECVDDETQTEGYKLAPINDPVKYAYQKTNYCLTNAPDCDLINALSVCAPENTGTSPKPLTNKQLEDMASYYNNEYLKNCGYLWGNGQSVTTNPKWSSQDSGTNPNNPNLKDGPNDQALVYLLACAKKRKITNNKDINDLQKACGSACEGSS